MKKEKHRSAFTGSIGFVLAAAGSAVGLGNIWRFPYLASKNGGGLFLVTYIVLALTFGFTLLITEVTIGRKTKKSPLMAYGELHKKYKWLGIIACLVPVIIMPYYCVIGGWVIKYMVTYCTGQASVATQDGYFTSYISGEIQPIVYMAIFILMVTFVVIKGVDKGIEKCSKILMPMLLILVVGIAIFALTLSYKDNNGTVRTGIEGFLIYIIPNIKGLTAKGFFSVLLDAMRQLFYSLSVAMGIMIAYGSYVKDDAKIMKSINQIEIFDTVVAFLAGVMIIPTVYVFAGREGMEDSGPSLMFVSLPKIFESMGKIGVVIGALFFVMVLFAALTSAVSIMEAIIAAIIDKFHISRVKACIIETLIALLAGVVVCLGYNVLYADIKLPNGSVGQILDVMDYVSNNLLMPIVAILTCILIGWVVKPKVIIDEVEKTGCKFGRKKLYILMLKYIAPILLAVLLLKSLGILTII